MMQLVTEHPESLPTVALVTVQGGARWGRLRRWGGKRPSQPWGIQLGSSDWPSRRFCAGETLSAHAPRMGRYRVRAAPASFVVAPVRAQPGSFHNLQWRSISWTSVEHSARSWHDWGL